MPARDGTGPMGMGPMTGRGMGFCAGVSAPKPTNTAPGCGFWRRGGGRGRERGWRNMFYATGLTGWQRAAAGWPMRGGVTPNAAPSKEQELAALKGQAQSFEGALGDIQKRIEELEAENAKK